MAPVIRNFKNSDFNRLVDLHSHSFETEEQVDNVRRLLSIKLSRPGYDPKKNLTVVETGTGLFGYGDLIFERPILRAVCEFFFSSPERLEVEGSQLLDQILQRCRELGASVLQSNVAESKRETSQFLETHGFLPVRSYHKMTVDLRKTSALREGTQNIELKPFKEGQEMELAELQNRIFKETWGFCPNSLEEITYYLLLLNARIDDVLSIEEKGKKVGYVWTHALPNSREKNQHFRIHMMGVDPDYRGRGLGRILLESALSSLFQKGAVTVELTVDSLNKPALGLYFSLGFVMISRSFWYERKLV